MNLGLGSSSNFTSTLLEVSKHTSFCCAAIAEGCGVAALAGKHTARLAASPLLNRGTHCSGSKSRKAGEITVGMSKGRLESLECFAVQICKRFRKIIEIDQRFSHVVRPRAKRLPLSRRCTHITYSPPQSLVYYVFQARIAGSAEPFQLHRDIVIDRQRGPHASELT
jgi:hypothetical protein